MLARSPLPAALVVLLLSSLLPLQASAAHGSNHGRKLAFHERYAHNRRAGAPLEGIISAAIAAGSTEAATSSASPTADASTSRAAASSSRATADDDDVTTSSSSSSSSSSLSSTPARVTSSSTSLTSSSASSTSEVESSSAVSSSSASSSSATSSSSSSASDSTSSSAEPSSSSTSESTSSSSTASSSAPVTSLHTSTDAGGRVVTVIASAIGSSDTAKASASETARANTGGGLSTGAIVGISVVAGVVALAGGLYLIFALTKRRGRGGDDDGGIKWPELNAHGQEDEMMGVALPARPTGGAGLRTNALDGEDSDDEEDETSRGTHLASIGPDSTESYAYTQPQQPNNSDIFNATPYVTSPAGGAEHDGNAYYGYDDGYSQQHGYDAYDPQQQDAYAHRSADGHYDQHQQQAPQMAEAYPQKPVAAMAAAFGAPQRASGSSGGDDPFSAAGVSRNHY